MRILLSTLTLAGLLLLPFSLAAQEKDKMDPAADKGAAKADDKPVEKAPSTEKWVSTIAPPAVPAPGICLIFGFAVTICAVGAKMLNRESTTMGYVILAAIALSAIMYAFSYKAHMAYAAAVDAELKAHNAPVTDPK